MPDADYLTIDVALSMQEWGDFPGADAARKAVPSRYFDVEDHDAVIETARELSAAHPTVPICVEEISGRDERDTNAFNATAFREVRRYLAGAEVEVPTDEWAQYQ